MRGLLLTLVAAMVAAAGSATATDLIYSETNTSGNLGSTQIVLQVHCTDTGPGAGAAPEAELYVDGVKVTPDQLGDEAQHDDHRTATGDMLTDFKFDDAQYNDDESCQRLIPILGTALIPASIVSQFVHDDGVALVASVIDTIRQGPPAPPTQEEIEAEVAAIVAEVEGTAAPVIAEAEAAWDANRPGAGEPEDILP